MMIMLDRKEHYNNLIKKKNNRIFIFDRTTGPAKRTIRSFWNDENVIHDKMGTSRERWRYAYYRLYCRNKRDIKESLAKG